MLALLQTNAAQPPPHLLLWLLQVGRGRGTTPTPGLNQPITAECSVPPAMLEVRRTSSPSPTETEEGPGGLH